MCQRETNESPKTEKRVLRANQQQETMFQAQRPGLNHPNLLRIKGHWWFQWGQIPSFSDRSTEKERATISFPVSHHDCPDDLSTFHLRMD